MFRTMQVAFLVLFIPQIACANQARKTKWNTSPGPTDAATVAHAQQARKTKWNKSPDPTDAATVAHVKPFSRKVGKAGEASSMVISADGRASYPETSLQPQTTIYTTIMLAPTETSTPTTTSTTTAQSWTTSTTTAQSWVIDALSCSKGPAAVTTITMTCEMYDNIVSGIRTLYDTLPTVCNNIECPQADWAGCVLRMAGHDFMDFKDGQGGSDGCTDMLHPDNAGLPECLHTGEFGISIRDAYQDVCTEVSAADFIVLAAEAIMTISREHELAEVPAKKPIDFKNSFKWGRSTSLTCIGGADLLPNPEDGCAANERVFVNNMGLTWRQTAALMGVHTLGRARTDISGYDGFWSDPHNSRKFNADYFISMVHKGWEPEKGINGNLNKNQWERSDVNKTAAKEMMLDTDMCLAYNKDNLASSSSCCTWWKSPENEFCGSDRAKCCEQYSTGPDCGSTALTGAAAGDVLDFSGGHAYDQASRIRGEDKWIEVFLEAWGQATTNGFTGLQDLHCVHAR